jgi:hydrogenase/urease accessory protein HupE
VILQRSLRATIVLVFATVAALAASVAQAHPEGFSGLHIVVSADRVHASVTVHTRDTSKWFPPGQYPDYVKDVCAALVATPGDVVEISFDGTPAAPTNVKAFQVEVGLLELDADFARPRDAAVMTVWSKHLSRLPRGHQQILTVDSESDENIYQDTLDAERATVDVELPSTSATTRPTTLATTAPPPRRVSFFMLGVEHIVTGYDHLLFLAALLLVCKTFREAAGVVTFFTVAHSITLSQAALDVVRLPARIVEPAIAASILYVGLENIWGKHRFAWRAAITFAFGLVHGLGFASALREVGLGSTSVGIAMPLLKFSIGLETGQLTIAAVLLTILLKLRQRPLYTRRFVPIGSSAVAAVGLFWLITRMAAG